MFIDDAITPLIIAGEGPNQDHVEAFERAVQLAGELDPATEYQIDRRYGEVNLTQAGKQRLAALTEPMGGAVDRRPAPGRNDLAGTCSPGVFHSGQAVRRR